MRAKEFFEGEVVSMQNWKRDKNLPVFDVSYKDLYRNFIHLWNTGDEWGDTMNVLFAIADELYNRGEGPPNHWDYNPGMAVSSSRDSDREMSDQEKYDKAVGQQQGQSEDGVFNEYMDLEHVDTPTLEKFGEFLLELREKLKAEGKDY